MPSLPARACVSFCAIFLRTSRRNSSSISEPLIGDAEDEDEEEEEDSEDILSSTRPTSSWTLLWPRKLATASDLRWVSLVAILKTTSSDTASADPAEVPRLAVVSSAAVTSVSRCLAPVVMMRVVMKTAGRWTYIATYEGRVRISNFQLDDCLSESELRLERVKLVFIGQFVMTKRRCS